MGWPRLMAVQNLTKSVSVIEVVSQTSGNSPAKIVCNHLCTMTIMERKSIVKTKMAYVFRLHASCPGYPKRAWSGPMHKEFMKPQAVTFKHSTPPMPFLSELFAIESCPTSPSTRAPNCLMPTHLDTSQERVATCANLKLISPYFD